jgi:hypothetical protein
MLSDNGSGGDEDEVVEEQSISEWLRLYTATELPARSEAQLPSAVQKRSRNWRRV